MIKNLITIKRKAGLIKDCSLQFLNYCWICNNSSNAIVLIILKAYEVSNICAFNFKGLKIFAEITLRL